MFKLLETNKDRERNKPEHRQTSANYLQPAVCPHYLLYASAEERKAAYLRCVTTLKELVFKRALYAVFVLCVFVLLVELACLNLAEP